MIMLACIATVICMHREVTRALYIYMVSVYVCGVVLYAMGDGQSEDEYNYNRVPMYSTVDRLCGENNLFVQKVKSFYVKIKQ